MQEYTYDDLWNDEFFTNSTPKGKYKKEKSSYTSFYDTFANLQSKYEVSKPISERHRDQFFNNPQYTAPLPRQPALNFIGRRIIPYRVMIDASTQNTDGFAKVNNSSQKLSESEKLHTPPIKINYLG